MTILDCATVSQNALEVARNPPLQNTQSYGTIKKGRPMVDLPRKPDERLTPKFYHNVSNPQPAS